MRPVGVPTNLQFLKSTILGLPHYDLPWYCYPCIDWDRGICGTGYGSIKRRQIEEKVHRVAWELANGPIPKGMMVCHHCDRRICYSPAHLFIGSALDNSRDMDAKGRDRRNFGPKGEKCGLAKLTTVQVLRIRDIYSAGGISQTKLGGMFGVTQGAIFSIVNRKTWASV